MRRPKCARESFFDGRVEFLIDGDPFPGGVQVGFERRDALGKLGHAVGKRADDIAGSAHMLRLVRHAVTLRSLGLYPTPRVRAKAYTTAARTGRIR